MVRPQAPYKLQITCRRKVLVGVPYKLQTICGRMVRPQAPYKLVDRHRMLRHAIREHKNLPNIALDQLQFVGEVSSLSPFYLVDEIQGTYRGMAIALDRFFHDKIDKLLSSTFYFLLFYSSKSLAFKKRFGSDAGFGK